MGSKPQPIEQDVSLFGRETLDLWDEKEGVKSAAQHREAKNTKAPQLDVASTKSRVRKNRLEAKQRWRPLAGNGSISPAKADRAEWVAVDSISTSDHGHVLVLLSHCNEARMETKKVCQRAENFPAIADPLYSSALIDAAMGSRQAACDIVAEADGKGILDLEHQAAVAIYSSETLCTGAPDIS
ncbi:Fc.00g084100.m01.CDS01 [Cosmosporella sp. VM-42]